MARPGAARRESRACAARGRRLHPLENFAAAIDERTQLVAITHVCFRNGAKLDVAGIVRLAHAKGAKVLLDCYHRWGRWTST